MCRPELYADINQGEHMNRLSVLEELEHKRQKTLSDLDTAEEFEKLIKRFIGNRWEVTYNTDQNCISIDSYGNSDIGITDFNFICKNISRITGDKFEARPHITGEKLNFIHTTFWYKDVRVKVYQHNTQQCKLEYVEETVRKAVVNCI